MDVLISGATGLVGGRLTARLAAAGHRCRALSRDPAHARARVPALAEAYPWSPTEEPPPPEALRGVDAVVHLAGESVVGRWTEAKRRAIHDSRVIGTRNLVTALRALEAPPTLVSASAIGFYGDRGDLPLTESAPAGEGFLADVCRGWEAAAAEAEALGARVVRLRIGLVLGARGGALDAMLRPFRLGLGGPLGGGLQWWSWIHLEDVVGLIEQALVDDRLRGAVNATAPQPLRQREFARVLGRSLGRWAVLPVPRRALELALGDFASELLASRRVLPRAAEEARFAFAYPALEDALADLLRRAA